MMDFETVFEKIKYDRMTISEFGDWVAVCHKESCDEGYEEGYSKGFEEGYANGSGES